ncbi:homoserine dehydrogenase [Sulfoacidibacillus thermotolerans]|uniref:Homoserine dehydrogenase n=1 Tax=Sulfoacidibacillus thermotolerans TaxID=1765684 RepID=A0A2U3DC94_SULT2|nr:homoserine dehydrogenase [Sulfoacidibacillus thermotolerans]PWI58882.1 hypothetical protein BM613_02005 [Sulfoacidibacillus thermotolerans]
MANVKQIYIGLLGLGTVGSGVVKSLLANEDHIIAQTGFQVRVKRALVQNLQKQRSVRIDQDFLTTDAISVLVDPEISIVVEVMGGIEPALGYIRSALQAGKHVITANKELLAKHGDELALIAKNAGVRLLYEASVAGGIPIVRMLQAYLTANRVTSIRGILNGTSNYILTRMQGAEVTFAQALAEAQQLGYAEAAPQSDVEGYDAAYKLSILANMAFPVQTEIACVDRMGITEIEPVDIAFAKQLGCVIKLIAEASYKGGQVRLSVSPKLLSQSDSLATISDVFNAVTVEADVVGELTFIGRGAGEMPTASAVIEDIVEVLRTPTIPATAPKQKGTCAGVGVFHLREVQNYYVRIHFAKKEDAIHVSAWETAAFCSEDRILEVGRTKDEYTRAYLIATDDRKRIDKFIQMTGVLSWIVMPYGGDFVVHCSEPLTELSTG